MWQHGMQTVSPFRCAIPDKTTEQVISLTHDEAFVKVSVDLPEDQAVTSIRHPEVAFDPKRELRRLEPALRETPDSNKLPKPRVQKW